MSQSAQEAARWATSNGFQFHEDGESRLPPVARELDSFRNLHSVRQSVSGRALGRAFEMVDVTNYFRGGQHGTPGYQDRTVLLFPGVQPSLPDFEIITRKITGAAELFGVSGLELSLADSASSAGAELIERFNEEYQLHAGGLSRTASQAREIPDQLARPAPDPAVVAMICKPDVLRFLGRHPGWFIESQNGFFALSKPMESEHLTERRRFEVLKIADEFVRLLGRAESAPAIPNLQVLNTLNPKQVWGTLIGLFGGFFLGVFVAMVLLIFRDGNFGLATPLFAFGGLIIGGLIGRMVGRAMS